MPSLETTPAPALPGRETRSIKAERQAYQGLCERESAESPPRVLVRAGRTYAELHVLAEGRVALVAERPDGGVELFWRGRCAAGETVKLPVPTVIRVVALWMPTTVPPRRSLAALLEGAVDFDSVEVHRPVS